MCQICEALVDLYEIKGWKISQGRNIGGLQYMYHRTYCRNLGFFLLAGGGLGSHELCPLCWTCHRHGGGSLPSDSKSSFCHPWTCPSTHHQGKTNFNSPPLYQLPASFKKCLLFCFIFMWMLFLLSMQRRFIFYNGQVKKHQTRICGVRGGGGDEVTRHGGSLCRV